MSTAVLETEKCERVVSRVYDGCQLGSNAFRNIEELDTDWSASRTEGRVTYVHLTLHEHLNVPDELITVNFANALLSSLATRMRSVIEVRRTVSSGTCSSSA